MAPDNSFPSKTNPFSFKSVRDILVFNSVFLFAFSFMMAFNQIDEDETGPKKRTAFEEFQNALQSVIASYVECPQVT